VIPPAAERIKAARFLPILHQGGIRRNTDSNSRIDGMMAREKEKRRLIYYQPPPG
jgi:hypothetical protein